MSEFQPFPLGTVPTLEEIDSMIKKQIPDCPMCHTKLGDIESYQHENGMKIKDFHNKRWIYFKCAKCNYQWALWKLLQRIRLRSRQK